MHSFNFSVFCWSVHLAAVIIPLPPITPIHASDQKNRKPTPTNQINPTYPYPYPIDKEIHTGRFI
ncbi:hypothetical protein AAZV13_02G174900 [Glycine max]